jgi:hypothetical protein
MFYVGVDLGQAGDPSAISIAESVGIKNCNDLGETYFDTEYHIRYIQRLPLNTTYPAIVSHTHKMTLTKPLLDDYKAVLDGTGVGRPVVDLFRQANIRTIPVTITGGGTESFNDVDGYWHVPKKILVSNMQVLLGNNRVKFADDLPDKQTLINELINFKIKISTAGNDTYEAWREGQHDDLVLSIAIALWYANKFGAIKVDKTYTKHPLIGMKGL